MTPRIGLLVSFNLQNFFPWIWQTGVYPYEKLASHPGHASLVVRNFSYRVR